MPVSAHYAPAPRILALGDGFADPVRPARFPAKVERYFNRRAAESVGLGELSADERARHFWSFEPLPDNLREPLALRYHGHQFGIYNPDLGDGRGFLFAQLLEAAPPGAEPRLLDLGTKGSGITPYSRGGDGRLTLKGGVREVLATEMLEALGVPTSRTFSLFETGERLFRGDEPSPTRASVLVRLSHSHIRFGTFQRLAYAGDRGRLRAMLDFAVEQHLPEARSGPGDAVVRFVRAVAERSARVAAAWMAAGFAHGVLNTDNMNVTGESFDYGPYRFVPEYDPGFVAAYFDEVGMYAFGKQPRVVLSNVTRLADVVRPLSPAAPLGDALRAFEPAFFEALAGRVRCRLGLASAGHDLDQALADAVITFLDEARVPLDRFYFDWFGGAAGEARALSGPLRAHYETERGAALRRLLDQFRPASPAALSHPYFARPSPVTLLIDEIESLWAPIAERDDWALFESKLADIRQLGDALSAASAPAPPA